MSLQEDHDGKIQCASVRSARANEEGPQPSLRRRHNRMISETPMNRPPRLACIFTADVEADVRRRLAWSTSPAPSAKKTESYPVPARRGTSTSRSTTSSRSSLRCRRKSSYRTETR